MLRKKLSKLIVGIMAAVMVTVGGSGVGQAVFASSNAGVVATQATRIAVNDTNIETVLGDITYENVALTLQVNTRVTLTQKVAQLINGRKAPLTIEVGQGGRLEIDSQITLSGTKDNNLKLVRTGTKNGALLQTVPEKTPGTNVVNVIVENVTFENNSSSNPVNNEPYFENNQQNFVATLKGNTIVNGVNGNGILAYDRTPAQGQTTPVTNFIDNNLGSGSITDLYKLSTEITKPVYGSRVATVGGTISGNLLTGAKEVKAKITITDVNGNKVFKTYDNLTITNGSVETFVEGLTPGNKYSAIIEVNVTDANGNTYTRKSLAEEFITYTFSSSAVNVGNNSATVNINHGNLPNITPTKYPLVLTVNGVTATISPTSITSTTNSVSLTGLSAGTSYTYEIKSGTTVIDKGTFRTTSSTITGGGSTGGSVTSGDLTTNDINRADIKDVSSYIPVGNTTLANSLRDGRDYKTNIEGVSVTYSNGKVEFTGLVPEKDYRDLTITYTDKDGRTRTVKVPSFKTKVSETKLRQFIVDVYRYSLDRVADERGFAYWEDQLKNKKTSPDEFVKNLLNEREFINKHTTTTAKIEGLYQVIVNRKSDSQGLSFWTKKYDDLVARGYSESMALRVIVDEMVNEQEFKNRVRDLGL